MVLIKTRAGIIPANTGRMNTTVGTAFTAWDHPREYGENHVERWAILLAEGSSPRIRGEYLLT